MSIRYVQLAVLMLAVTYPSRALPLVARGVDRLPVWAKDYLQLVGPAVLATLAATSTLIATGSSGRRLEFGAAGAAVVVCVVVVTRRRNLLLGLTAAAGFAALVRLVGS